MADDDVVTVHVSGGPIPVGAHVALDDGTTATVVASVPTSLTVGTFVLPGWLLALHYGASNASGLFPRAFVPRTSAGVPPSVFLLDDLTPDTVVVGSVADEWQGGADG